MAERFETTLTGLASRLPPWLLPALLAGWFLVALGGAPLFDVDEGAFAEASREMLASGDFGHTTLNGADRFDKPMAVYWLQAASLALFGPTERSVRLPSAICAWLMCMVAWRAVRARWGESCALWVVLILCTATGPVLIGRAATADALLHLLLMLSAIDLWRHLRVGDAWALRRASIWMALGTLAKGPVAILIPGSAVILWLALHPSRNRIRQLLGDPIAWTLLLGLSLPWYAYAWWRHGSAFIEGFIIRHNLERFGGTLEGHSGPWWTYLVVLPLLCLPWTAVLLSVALRVRHIWREPDCRFALLWAGFVLLFFSFSGTKLPHYVLYALGPLSWLMAREAANAGRWLRVGIWLGLAVWLAGAAWIPAIGPKLAGNSSDLLVRALVGGAPASPDAGAVLAVAGAALAGCAVAAGGLWMRVALGASVVMAVLVFHTLPWAGEALQGPVRRAAWAARGDPGPVYQWHVHWPSVGFYSGRAVPKGEPRPGERAFVRLDRLPASLPVEVIHEERGVALVRLER